MHCPKAKHLFVVLSVALLPLEPLQAASNEEPLAMGPRILVPPTSLPEALRQDAELANANTSSLIAQALRDQGRGEAVTLDDVRAVADKVALDQLVGCDDLGCEADLGQMARADLLLRSELSRLGTHLVLTAVLVQLSEARVLNRQTVKAIGASELDRASVLVVRRLFGEEPKAVSEKSEPEKPMLSGKVVLVPIQAPATILDEKGRMALERHLASQMGQLPGLEVATTQEVLDVLKQEGMLQLLGSDRAADLSPIAARLNAPYMAVLTIGDVGGRVAVTASLVDVTATSTLARGSLPIQDNAQILDAATMVTLGLFGIERPLPSPVARPDRFPLAMQKLAQSLREIYAPHHADRLSRLAVLPLTDEATTARKINLGVTAGRHLEEQFAGFEIELVDKERMIELAEARDLTGCSQLGARELVEMGRFLGASHLVVGSVVDVGTDYMASTRLIDTISGTSLGVATAFVVKGETETLIDPSMFVVRTRADAIYRSIVPGWGQFYNGPEHSWKGFIVLGGTVLGAAVAGAMIGSGAWALSQKEQFDADHVGEQGNQYAELACDVDAQPCLERMRALDEQATYLMAGGAVAVGVMALFWVGGIVDAIVCAGD